MSRSAPREPRRITAGSVSRDGVGSWWERRRRLRVDETSKQLLGPDTLKPAGADDLASQQFQVGVFVRQCVDAGFDQLSLLQNLLVVSVWLADQIGVSREQIAKTVHAIEMTRDRQLIYKPGQ